MVHFCSNHIQKIETILVKYLQYKIKNKLTFQLKASKSVVTEHEKRFKLICLDI